MILLTCVLSKNVRCTDLESPPPFTFWFDEIKVKFAQIVTQKLMKPTATATVTPTQYSVGVTVAPN